MPCSSMGSLASCPKTVRRTTTMVHAPHQTRGTPAWARTLSLHSLAQQPSSHEWCSAKIGEIIPVTGTQLSGFTPVGCMEPDSYLSLPRKSERAFFFLARNLPGRREQRKRSHETNDHL